MTDWIMTIPTTFMEKIKVGFSETIKEAYSMTDENFSDTDSANSGSIFPYVYSSLLTAAEVGGDLEGLTINGGTFAFQVDVTDDASQDNVKEIMTEIVRLLKTMRFEIIAMPVLTSADSLYKGTVKAQRTISAGDTL